MEPPLEFATLFQNEHALLSQVPLKEVRTGSPGAAGEPWIRYTPFDRVGLAFSGGGIRSATFNLGVLQALHGLRVREHRVGEHRVREHRVAEHRVLELVDYL